MSYNSCRFYGWAEPDGFVIRCDNLNEAVELVEKLDDAFKRGETEWTTQIEDEYGETTGSQTHRITVQRRSKYHPHIAQLIRDEMGLD
jgi:hypothetical protein